MKAAATTKKSPFPVALDGVNVLCAEIDCMCNKVLKKNKYFCIMYVQGMVNFLHL